MKTRLTLLILLSLALCIQAQENAPTKPNATEIIRQWDTETMLDSLDQEKLPKLVTGGVLMNANISNFITSHSDGHLSSYMKVGGETGGFIHFRVTKHFAIEGRAILTAEQNQFGVDETMRMLWSFGMDIPVYFLGRFGNMQKGYLQFGAGPFTHFTFASNIANNYSNNLATKPIDKGDPYEKLYVLHDNHSGVTATIGYEFPIGIQINANYLVSLTDIFNYYKQEGKETVKSIYPQRISLGIAYRWK